MGLWRGDYAMRMATFVPFLAVSQLVAHTRHHPDGGRLIVAVLLGLVAAIAGWATLTAWRRTRHHDDSASTAGTP
jgi:hypothetical protein